MPDLKTARERIPVAAVDLFGRRGIAGTTIDDIARRARCSQAAIYKYWESKDVLAEAIFRRTHTEMMEAIDAGQAGWTEPAERVIAALIAFIRHARSRPADFAFLFHVFHTDYARWLSGRRKPSDAVREEIERGMRDGSIPPGDAALRTALVLGMAIRLALFERQGLLVLDAAAVEAELSAAAAAALGV